jgi:cytochrome c biogenesis protein CcdA
LTVDQRDVEGSTDNYNLLRSLERRYGVTRGEMPVIFIGDHVLAGEQEARDRLPELVEMYLDLGGVALPDVSLTLTPEPTPSADAEAPPIHLAYFYQPGCQECDRVQLALNYLQDEYPQLSVCRLDVREQAPLSEWLGEQAGVPVGKRLTAPAVFVGDDALVGEELDTSSLEGLLARYAETGAERICAGWEAASDETVFGIIERFRSFSLPTVLVAGLVDGLNPCAFATLVFFISYLAFVGRDGRDVLLAGGAFALGVFLTYLGVGFGVLKFLATLPFLDAASRWVYGITAALCLLLAVGSLYDWWQARRGKATEMRLKMPTRLRRWVNRTIREGTGVGAFVPVTFGTGVVVSVIELACTGQVYLPTILFVLGVPELQAQAGLYLVLYNLMFILPLVVVFVLAYFGTTSQQLGLLIHRHTAKVKLATAGLFLLLAGWMVVTLV